MSYKVIIADDEPLVLIGLQDMITRGRKNELQGYNRR